VMARTSAASVAVLAERELMLWGFLPPVGLLDSTC
jgi:hypothetical protein